MNHSHFDASSTAGREAMRASRRLLLLCGGAVLAWLGIGATPSLAATLTWDANGTTGGVTDGAGAWFGTGQWWDGSTSVTWASGDDAVFGVGGTGGAVTLSDTTSANSLSFNAFTGTYTIGTSGQTLTLGSGGLTMNSGAGTVTLVSPVTFSAAQTWTNNTSSLLTGSGAIDNGGFLFTAAGSGSTTLAGTLAGVGGLTKSGAGVLALSNTASTYSGVTTINGGILEVTRLAIGGANSSIGAASSAAANLVINGGTLRYAGSTAQTTDRLVTVGLNGATFDSSGSATVVISSTGGSVAYSGSGDRTLTFAGSYAGGNNQFGAVIADSGGKTSIVKTGTGTWLLGRSGGVNNTYTGSTTILAGTLIGGRADSQQGFGNTSAIYLGDTSGTNTATVQFGTGVATAFNSVSIIVQSGNSGTATIVNNTNTSMNGTVTLGSANSSGKSVVIRNIGDFRWTPNFNSVIQDPAGLVAGTAGTVIFDNADVNGDSANWRIAGANTYSGDTRLLSGSITIWNAAALQNSTLDLGFAGDTGSVVWNQNSTLGGLKGTRNLDTNGRTLSIGNNGQSTTYSGVLSGSGGLAKIGLGTLSLAGANTYTGATTVAAGTLSVGNASALGGSDGNLTASGGVLDLGGYGITRSGTVSFTGGTVQSGTLTNDTVAFVGQSGTVSASLAGAAGFTKSGTGTLSLTGSNSYAGGTVVNAGVLAVATKDALPGWNIADKLTVNSGGGVAVGADFADADVATMIATGSNFRAGAAIGFDTTAGNRTYTSSLVNSPQGALGLAKAGPNTLTLSGSNSYTGPTIISGGTVAFTFAGNQSLSGTISGAGSLAKSGAGTLTLGVMPTLTGTVAVTAGTLKLPNAAMGSFMTTIDGGTLDTSNGGTWGNNTVRFGQNGGTLSWGGANWFGTGTMTVISTAGAPTSQMIGTTYLNLAANTVNFTANGDINLNAPLANNGSIIKGGTGTLILAANAHGAGTQGYRVFVDAGTLRASVNDALGGTGDITFRGGTLQYNTASPTDWSSRIRNSGSAIAVDTNGRSITWSGTINSTNTGGLRKLGSGTLALNGTNAFTGATAISAGILSINGTNALQGTSGVGIAGGAGLRYTGGSTEFAKNVTVTAGSGTGTIENTGGGVLTLAGTLSKDNSVLRLTGGSFNVTGLITGTTVGMSDLVVDAALVTLFNTNSYSGPTFVYNSGTLMLGVSNAIPSDSVVTLGDATSGGTLDLNGATNAIGGLAFGSGGGMLRVAATSTSAAPLTAATGTMTLTNGTLDLAGSGSTAGLYRVLSAQSIDGAFASVTGTSAAYQVITTATSVDYQQRAVLGTVSVTNPATAIITGGSAAFSYSVANTALSGGATLSFTGTGLSSVAGASSGLASAEGTSSSVAGLLFTGTSIGFGQTGTFAVSDPNAFGSTTVTGTVIATVYDHATSSLASSLLTSTTISLGTYNYATQTWESGTSSAAFQIFNIASVFGAELTADLSLLSETGAGNGFTTDLNTYGDIVGGTSSQFTVFFDPTGLDSSAMRSTTFTLAMGDKTSMSGAAASNTLYVTAQVIVVPEPGAVALAGIGLAAAGWCGWRRNRSSRNERGSLTAPAASR